MKRRVKGGIWVAAAAAGAVGMFAPSVTQASVWNNPTSGGVWSDNSPTGWNGTGVPNSTTATADFSQVNITSNNTVHLDAPYIVNTVTFGDTDTSSPARWIIDDNGSNGVNTLTLDGTTPAITTNAGSTATISAVIAGPGFGVSGPGVLSLTGTNTNTGVVTVNAGATLHANQGVGFASTANIKLNGGILGVSSNLTTTLGTGAGQIQFAAVTHSGFSAAGGPAIVDLGSTAIGYDNSSSAGRIMVLNGPDADSTLTFATPISSGVRGYIEVDSGTAILSSVWKSSGSNVVQAKGGVGTLQLNAGWTITGSAHPEVGGGTLVLNNSAITAPISGASPQPLLIGVDLTSVGLPTTTDSTFTVQGASATVSVQNLTLGSAALKNGIVNLNGGVTSVERILKGAGTGTINFDGGTVQVLDPTFASTFMTGLTNAFIKVGGVTVDTNNNDTTIGQPLLTDAVSTGGGLTKISSGTLTLTGDNTYTGSTIVKSGVLLLSAASNNISASSKIIVGTSVSENSATLDVNSVTGGFALASGQTLGGFGIISGPVTITNGGHLAPGNSIGKLTTGQLTLTPGSTASSEFELGTPGSSTSSPGISDLVAVNGDLSLGGALHLTDNAGANGNGSLGTGTYLLFTYTGQLTNSTFDSISGPANTFYSLDTSSVPGEVFLNVTATPEPASLALLSLGGLGLLARRRRAR